MIPFRDNVPARRYPFVTVTLILANVAAFIYELSLQPGDLEALLRTYGLVPATLQAFPRAPLTVLGTLSGSLVSSTLLHGGFFHLIGNMWYLWIFGDNVEDRMGSGRFLVFYLLCGILAGVAHIAFNPSSAVPTIGASGAVAGVLGAYLVSYPFAKVLTLVPFFFFFVVEVPAVLLLGFWFLVQFINGTAAFAGASDAMGGVAWWAHIGGFLSGMLLITFFARKPVRPYVWD